MTSLTAVRLILGTQRLPVLNDRRTPDSAIATLVLGKGLCRQYVYSPFTDCFVQPLNENSATEADSNRLIQLNLMWHCFLHDGDKHTYVRRSLLTWLISSSTSLYCAGDGHSWPMPLVRPGILSLQLKKYWYPAKRDATALLSPHISCCRVRHSKNSTIHRTIRIAAMTEMVPSLVLLLYPI